MLTEVRMQEKTTERTMWRRDEAEKRRRNWVATPLFRRRAAEKKKNILERMLERKTAIAHSVKAAQEVKKQTSFFSDLGNRVSRILSRGKGS